MTVIFDNNHRLAILVTGLFFVAALGVLRTINMDRGRQVALTASQ